MSPDHKRLAIRVAARAIVSYAIATAAASAASLAATRDAETLGIAALIALFVAPSIILYTVLDAFRSGQRFALAGFFVPLSLPVFLLASLWYGEGKGPAIALYATVVLGTSASAAFMWLVLARRRTDES